MKMMRTAIIGGGASGLVAAINSTKHGEVVLFEKDERVGKKILQTGNGRCNFCNMNLSPAFYNNPDFVGKVFAKIGRDDLLDFFAKIGLCYCSDEEGRMYPASNQASSVLDTLRYECMRRGVEMQLSTDVKDIKIVDKKFEIEGKIFDKVIIATGNLPNSFIRELGHSSSTPRQGLCSLRVAQNDVLGLMGIRTKASVKLEYNGEKFVESGEIQFKNQALGGICIFNIASIISRKNIKNPTIFVDFAPKTSRIDLKNEINARLVKLKSEPIENVFVGMFQRLLSQFFLKRCDISPVIICSNIDEKKVDKLVEIIKNCPIRILGTEGQGQVRVGGIKVDEIDDNLMSKFVPNLYFVGECLDVDGLCGGYNLAWAWASALLASKQKDTF